MVWRNARGGLGSIYKISNWQLFFVIQFVLCLPFQCSNGCGTGKRQREVKCINTVTNQRNSRLSAVRQASLWTTVQLKCSVPMWVLVVLIYLFFLCDFFFNSHISTIGPLHWLCHEIQNSMEAMNCHLRPSSKLWARILQHFQMYTCTFFCCYAFPKPFATIWQCTSMFARLGMRPFWPTGEYVVLHMFKYAVSAKDR